MVRYRLLSREILNAHKFWLREHHFPPMLCINVGCGAHRVKWGAHLDFAPSPDNEIDILPPLSLYTCIFRTMKRDLHSVHKETVRLFISTWGPPTRQLGLVSSCGASGRESRRMGTCGAHQPLGLAPHRLFLLTKCFFKVLSSSSVKLRTSRVC